MILNATKKALLQDRKVLVDEGGTDRDKGGADILVREQDTDKDGDR